MFPIPPESEDMIDIEYLLCKNQYHQSGGHSINYLFEGVKFRNR